MRSSLLYSVGMHAIILGLAIVVLPSPEELPSVQTRALPVELVTIDEFTNLKKQVKTEKKVEKPKEEPKKPAPERPETKTEPKPEPTPPKPTQQAKAEAAPEPAPEKKAEPLPTKEAKKEPKPEEKPKEKPKPKPKPEKKVQKTAPKEKPKKNFDPNRLAALLNKMPEDSAPKQRQQETESNVDSPRTDDPDLPLTMSELDAFKVQMAKCWTVPAGAAGAEKLVVKIKVYLNPDGSLAQPPELMDRTKLITGGTTYRAAADAALRAVRLCQPFKMPADKYNSWREIDLTFDPRQMLGG